MKQQSLQLKCHQLRSFNFGKENKHCILKRNFKHCNDQCPLDHLIEKVEQKDSLKCVQFKPFVKNILSIKQSSGYQYFFIGTLSSTFVQSLLPMAYRLTGQWLL
jgi:hypothetical protein